jgi:hypothetical protein
MAAWFVVIKIEMHRDGAVWVSSGAVGTAVNEIAGDSWRVEGRGPSALLYRGAWAYAFEIRWDSRRVI